MIVNNKRNSVKHEVQENSLLGSDGGISDTSPKKKRSRRLAGRSKSLTDTTGSNSKPGETNRNMGRYTQSYLRRAPTQDDIYKIITETSDSIRPSTGESKRLSPYVPLPAIGTKFIPHKDSGSEVKETLDSTSAKSCGDGAQKLVREGTYNVLEPKFVKGPIVSDVSRNAGDNFEEIKNKEQSNEVGNQLKDLSTTFVFGPRLPKQEGVIEEDLTVTDLIGQQQHGDVSTTHLNTNTQTKSNVSPKQISIPMQKLYYRDIRKNESHRLGNPVTSTNTEDSVCRETKDRPAIQQALWFD